MTRTAAFAGLLFGGACDAPLEPDGDPESVVGETDAPVDTDTTSVPVTLEEGEAVICAAPLERMDGEFDQRLASESDVTHVWLWGGGLVVGDLDNDGDLDTFVSAEIRPRLYMWDGQAYAEEGVVRLPERNWAKTTGGSVVDYDGDGDLDLYINRFLRTNVLLENDGTGVFQDVTDETGLGLYEYRSMVSSWADFDRDGDLDLFVGNYGYVDLSGELPENFEPADPSKIYENLGDGTFLDRGDLLSAAAMDGYTYTGGWHDIDVDGWPDLYIINDFGAAYPNRLFWNDGGVLRADENAVGMDIPTTGMGVGVEDISGDGFPDFLIAAWNDIVFMESVGGVWYDTSYVRGLRHDISRAQMVGWGTDFGDIDNDGDLDATMAFGFIDLGERWLNPDVQPDAFFIQQPDGTFIDRGTEVGLDDGEASRGSVLADINRDGWLDISKQMSDGRNHLYLSRCGENSWMRVKLRAPPPNTYGIGARIQVIHEGTRVERVMRSGGTNHASGGPPEVHLGLGALERVDEVRVVWPDQRVSTVYDVTTRREILIRREFEPADE